MNKVTPTLVLGAALMLNSQVFDGAGMPLGSVGTFGNQTTFRDNSGAPLVTATPFGNQTFFTGPGNQPLGTIVGPNQ
jgi:hypothetical protein